MLFKQNWVINNLWDVSTAIVGHSTFAMKHDKIGQFN